MTQEEFLAKCEYEGFEYALMDYGLSEKDLDDKGGEFFMLVREASSTARHLSSLIGRLEEYGND